MKIYSKIIIFMTVSSIFLLVPQVEANGDDYLSQSYIWQGQGAYVANGIGMWGQGGSSASGYITISEIPAGATIEKAFLYWSSWQEISPPVTSITVNGNQISEELIGTVTETDVSWPPYTPHTYRGYRADISSIVTGNGDYQASGFPTGTVYDNQQTMGASIVVIYSLPTKPFVTIIINDGMAALHNRPQSYTTTISGFTAPTSPIAQITYIAGQAESNWNLDWEYFNGNLLAQNGLDGSNGPLWDVDSYDVSSYISQGDKTATVEVSMENDWIGWVAAIFQIETEISVPPQPPIAYAGLDQTVISGDTVYFDGSNSFDPDGIIAEYHWDFGDGDVSDQIEPAHRFRGSPYGKIYTVTLTVKDNNGNIGKDTVEITVKPLEIDLEVLYTQTFPPNEVSAKIKVPYNWVSSNKGYDEYVVNPIEYEYGGKFSGFMSITVVEDQLPIEIWAYDDAIKNPEGDTIIGRLYTTSDGWISKAHTPSYDTPEGTFHGITVKNENKIVLSLLGWAGTRIVGVVDGPPNIGTLLKLIRPDIIENDGAYFNPNPGSKPEYMRSASLEIVHIASPGELRVYDSQNKITGLINGEIKEDIPFSFYDDNDKTVVIMNPSGNNVYEVKGKETGSYGLYVGHVNNIDFDTTIDFNAISIPITPEQNHQYTIDWDVLSQGEDGVIMKIDINGDGIIEDIITSDDILTIDEFILQTETSIDINPDTLNLKSNGKWITAYIELPTGYNVGDIELSSINLVSESGDIISSLDLSDPTTIGDYDNNVISDLMVKFSRLDVVNYFGVTDSTEGIGNDVMVKMSISGQLNDGTQFEGSDSVRLIRNGK